MFFFIEVVLREKFVLIKKFVFVKIFDLGIERVLLIIFILLI